MVALALGIAIALVALVLLAAALRISRGHMIAERNRAQARQTAADAARASALDEAVARAGLAMSGGAYLLVAALASAFAGIVAAALTRPLVGIAVAAAVGALFAFYLMRAGKARSGAFEDQLGDCLPMVAGNIRSGKTFEAAVRNVAAHAEDPLKTQFEILALERSMGIPLEAAMANMAERTRSRDAAMLATVVAVQAETGGSMADVIDSIAGSIQRRSAMRRKVSAVTADGRYSAVIIGAIPVVVTAALAIMSPGYLTPLFTTPVGIAALAVAIGMVVAGELVIRRLYQIEIY